jgi:hypothetical protein
LGASAALSSLAAAAAMFRFVADRAYEKGSLRDFLKTNG